MAAEFARRFDSQLTMLHVAPLFPEGTSEIRRSWLDQFGETEVGGLHVERVMLCSDKDKASEIVTYANQHETDLVLMPTHGFGPFRRFLFGSVTLKVLHDALCPVWTTAHTEEPVVYRDTTFHNVVCAVDLSDKSCPTMRWAAEFAKTYGAQLTIVHAVPFVIPTGWEYRYPDWQRDLADSSRQEVDDLRRNLGLNARIDIAAGDPANAVRQAAEAAHADLLVIGRSIPDGLVGRLRSHGYPIIRQSPCPVIGV
jgi:nucleotide-binding universal stress UspA family protein